MVNTGSESKMNWKIVVFFLSAIFTVHGRQLPARNETSSEEDDDDMLSDIPVCHYSDPKITECIRRAAEHARVFLASGVPSLGIQPLEPLHVPSVRLRQRHGAANQFRYDAWLSDVMLRGLTDYTFNSLDIFPEQLRVVANMSLPQLQLTAEFVVLGHFQKLPVEATGKLSANMSACTARLEAQGARVHKQMVVRDALVRLQCAGPLAADLHDKHSATDDMAMITDHIVSMHSSEVLQEVQPAVETALAMVLEDIANKFLKHVPYNMVFPN